MTNLPSPEAIKYSSSRISIAILDEHVWRIGAGSDLEQENKPLSFPTSLRRFAPSAEAIIEYRNQQLRKEQYLGAPHPTPDVAIQDWLAARANLWRAQPPETKPLRDWLKQITPPCSLSTGSLQKYWKTHRERLSFHPKSANLRKILDTPLTVTLHRGYIHGALIPRRIREHGFICWRHASEDGLRGSDVAPFLSPTDQPLDIQLHILKWAWKNDPILLGETLVEMGLITPLPQRTDVSIVDHHPAMSKNQILHVLNIQEGMENTLRVRKALYRARKLNLGDRPVVFHGTDTLLPAKDSAFFLPRNRSPQELFSRWNQGIRLDQQGRYSVTPERHALEIAQRISAPLVVDAFCGCGGNTIAFARQPTIKKIISLEIDPVRYQMAQHNAAIYGVESKIKFQLRSALESPPNAPFVFLDPPWEWGFDKLDALRKTFQTKYQHGMMKLPVSFPFPEDSQVRLYLTAENYPSFAVLEW